MRLNPTLKRIWPLAVLHAAVAALCVAWAQAPTNPSEASPGGLGETKQAAIEVCKPSGQREYLSRLVCADGATPTFSRTGSYGNRTELPKQLPPEQGNALLQRILSGAPLEPGEPDYHVVDGYEVICGSVKRTLYFDMYHCSQPPPNSAPHGFTLRPSR